MRDKMLKLSGLKLLIDFTCTGCQTSLGHFNIANGRLLGHTVSAALFKIICDLVGPSYKVSGKFEYIFVPRWTWISQRTLLHEMRHLEEKQHSANSKHTFYVLKDIFLR